MTDDAFAAALTFSEKVHRLDAIRSLHASIASRTCGDCHFWMKPKCPRETNANGYSRGPGANHAPCGKWSEGTASRELRDHWRQELERMVRDAR